jgi:hypothetical protein
MTSAQARSRKREILTEIAKLDFCLPGSLVERTTRCGTPTCRCHNDPDRRHGPYPSWIRKVGAKTVTHTLTATQAERYRAWFDNTRRLRTLVDELEALSVQVINDAEGWTHTTSLTASTPSSRTIKRTRPRRGPQPRESTSRHTLTGTENAGYGD